MALIQPIMSNNFDATSSGRAAGGRDEAEVEFVMSALDAAGHTDERRRSRRCTYRVRAALQLFADMYDGQAIMLYTRDITPKSLGFITRHRLPLGYGGVVDLPDPAGVVRSIDCTLIRCREVAKGWYEGAVYFNREQSEFQNDCGGL